MLQQNTLQFLTDLKANNNKAWLDAHRTAYEQAKADFSQLISLILNGLSQQDSELARVPLEAKNCVYALNRDVRFSADKSPYKTNFSARFNLGGKKAPTAGYYLSVEPGNSVLLGGMYEPEPNILAKIRQEIDYNLADFEQLLTAPTFKTQVGSLQQEEALKRPPKGYETDNPAIEYLKLRSFTGSHPLSDDELTKPGLVEQTLTVYASLTPLVHYLNRFMPQTA